MPYKEVVKIRNSILLILFIVLSIIVVATEYNNIYEELIATRAVNNHNYISQNDWERLQLVIPYMLEIAVMYNIEPIIFIALIEQESSYKWIYGDSGNSVGFTQLSIGAGWYVKSKYEEELNELGFYNLDFHTPYDLYITPLRTTVLSFFYLIEKYVESGNLATAVSKYNGINNDEYVIKFFERYCELHELYFQITKY